MTVLAQACGPAFEPLATHLLPALFKTLAMGIQVGSREGVAQGKAGWAAPICSESSGGHRRTSAEFLDMQ